MASNDGKKIESESVKKRQNSIKISGGKRRQYQVNLAPPDLEVTTKRRKLNNNQSELQSNTVGPPDNIFNISNIVLLSDGVLDIFIKYNDEDTLHSFGQSVNAELASEKIREKMAKHKLLLSLPKITEYKILLDHVKSLHKDHNMNYQKLYALSRDEPNLDIGQYHNIKWQAQPDYILEKVSKIGHILLFTNIAKRINKKKKITYLIGVFGLMHKSEIFAAGVLYVMQHVSYLVNCTNGVLNNLFIKVLYHGNLDAVRRFRSELNAPIKHNDFYRVTLFTCCSTWKEVMAKAEEQDLEVLEILTVAYENGDIKEYDILNEEEITELYTAYADIMHNPNYRIQMKYFLETSLRRNALTMKAIEVANELLHQLSVSP